jgi:hypothetical protein
MAVQYIRNMGDSVIGCMTWTRDRFAKIARYNIQKKRQVLRYWIKDGVTRIPELIIEKINFVAQ